MVMLKEITEIYDIEREFFMPLIVVVQKKLWKCNHYLDVHIGVNTILKMMALFSFMEKTLTGTLRNENGLCYALGK